MRISSIAIGMALLALLAGPLTFPAAADPWDSDTGRRKPEDRKKDAPKDARPVPGLDKPSDVLGPGAGSGASDEAIPDNGAWTIVLIVYRGEQRDQLARLALNKVRVEGGLPAAFIEKRGDSTVVAVGRFAAGDSPEAASELKRVKDMVVAGQKPYEFAVLAPPANKSFEGSIPEYNLLRAKELFGDDAIYTLQVAVYGREDLERPTEKDLAEPRRAAEQAAMRLRQQGETAFYYHGVRRSMVTIGVFDLSDFDPQTPTYQSARLREVKERHPHNLYNGAGIREKKKGAPERFQPSTLVAIPSK